ncbi:hypothetical protein WN982_13040 [Paraburkholderia sp. IMGN_8]|uniref:hypothetical protein n=1 Tax=Paraburkholderia sp. IMGN_8 TaxID=3136564 RepID=UPI003100F349
MKKSLRDLLAELNALDSKIHLASISEGEATGSAAQAPKVPATTRRRVQQALESLPVYRGGRTGVSRADA